MESPFSYADQPLYPTLSGCQPLTESTSTYVDLYLTLNDITLDVVPQGHCKTDSSLEHLMAMEDLFTDCSVPTSVPEDNGNCFYNSFPMESQIITMTDQQTRPIVPSSPELTGKCMVPSLAPTMTRRATSPADSQQSQQSCVLSPAYEACSPSLGLMSMHGAAFHRRAHHLETKELDSKWNRELLEMSVRELNRYIRSHDLSVEDVAALKKARRRLKNRQYAKKSREKKKSERYGGDSDEEEFEEDDRDTLYAARKTSFRRLTRQ